MSRADRILSLYPVVFVLEDGDQPLSTELDEHCLGLVQNPMRIGSVCSGAISQDVIGFAHVGAHLAVPPGVVKVRVDKATTARAHRYR